MTWAWVNQRKTFIGSEKAINLHKTILVVCQKSKVEDWMEHFKEYYSENTIIDLTNIKANKFVEETELAYTEVQYYGGLLIMVINYDLIWRRPELSQLQDFTLVLDESSLIQNDTSKRSKFIIKKLNPTNVILLSGTPVGGKYEKLISQIHLLGWNISKKLFQNQY